MESILTSIKKLLGIAESDTSFDDDIIIDINSVLSILTQIGVGPSTGFFIEDNGVTWNDFIPNNPKLNLVKSYIYLKVRLLFDPPISSSVTDSINRMAGELEWRIQVTADPIDT